MRRWSMPLLNCLPPKQQFRSCAGAVCAVGRLQQLLTVTASGVCSSSAPNGRLPWDVVGTALRRLSEALKRGKEHLRLLVSSARMG